MTDRDLLEKILSQMKFDMDAIQSVALQTKANTEAIQSSASQTRENTDIMKALLHRTEELDAEYDGLLHTTASGRSRNICIEEGQVNCCDNKALSCFNGSVNTNGFLRQRQC
ncbi:hypothetical protein [Anaerosinus massiliensis]|uniref:hypothetical protein n=1 Tax=Massilibacillus massiliensis TaxID=1806837 RepID=UPI000DA636E1|nr:hypothetical protein [Massilibacillus massiliensis]